LPCACIKIHYLRQLLNLKPQPNQWLCDYNKKFSFLYLIARNFEDDQFYMDAYIENMMNYDQQLGWSFSQTKTLRNPKVFMELIEMVEYVYYEHKFKPKQNREKNKKIDE
jgi:hypothetical protein